MAEDPKFVIQVDNKELMEYFESWLDDFKRVSEGMLEKINVDRGATLKIPESDFRKLKILTESLDGLSKKKFGFENAPDFTPMVGAMKRLEACLEKVYIPEKIEMQMPDIKFPAIPAPVIDFTPLLQGIQDLSKLMQKGISASITNFDQMPLVFDKASGATAGSTGSGDASEATLQAILSAISDVVTNTAAISIDADSVNLNTDTLETLIASTNTKLDTLITQTNGVEAPLATLAGAVAGTEMQVDVVAPLPAGTNAIGKLAANSGVVIGSVEIATAQTIAVTNAGITSIDGKTPALGQALAAASVPVVLTAAQITTLTPPAAITNFANETGGNLAAIKAKTDNIPALGQALDAGSVPVVLTAAQIATLTPPAQGLTDAQLRATAVPISVASIPSHDVTNSGTFLSQNVGNIAHDSPGTGSNPMLMGGYASAAAPASVNTDGDAVRAWYIRNGAQATVLTAAGALIGGDATNGIDVDVTRLPALVAGSAVIGKVGIDQTTPGTTNGVQIVAAIPAGTNNIGDVDVLTIPGIVGTIADDATTPGHPVMIGGTAVETDGTDPGSVSAEDDVVRARFDRNRRQLVNGMHPNSFVLFEDHTTAQTNNQLKAAPGAGLSIYITDVIFSNGATAGSIKLVEDEGGTPVQIGATVYMAVNGGAVMNFATPKRLTANKTLGFTSTTVTTHTVEIHGYIAP